MRPCGSAARIASSSWPHVCRTNNAVVYLQRETSLTAGVTWPNTRHGLTSNIHSNQSTVEGQKKWKKRKTRAANNVRSRKNAHLQYVLRKLQYKCSRTHTYTNTHTAGLIPPGGYSYTHTIVWVCASITSLRNIHRRTQRTPDRSDCQSGLRYFSFWWENCDISSGESHIDPKVVKNYIYRRTITFQNVYHSFDCICDILSEFPPT